MYYIRSAIKAASLFSHSQKAVFLMTRLNDLFGMMKFRKTIGMANSDTILD